jgi:hypothetical protein
MTLLDTNDAAKTAPEHNVKIWCKWRPEHIAMLKALLDDEHTYAEAAIVINESFGSTFSERSCQNAAHRAGLKSKVNGSSAWTDAQRKTLKTLIDTGFSYSTAAGSLNRQYHTTFSKSACIGQMNQMRLRAGGVVVKRATKRGEGLTAKQKAIKRREKRWAENPSLEDRYKRLQSMAANRKRTLAMGDTKTSKAYRSHLPKVSNMSKAELRAMLSQAVQNTAAMGVAV